MTKAEIDKRCCATLFPNDDIVMVPFLASWNECGPRHSSFSHVALLLRGNATLAATHLACALSAGEGYGGTEHGHQYDCSFVGKH